MFCIWKCGLKKMPRLHVDLWLQCSWWNETQLSLSVWQSVFSQSNQSFSEPQYFPIEQIILKSHTSEYLTTTLQNNKHHSLSFNKRHQTSLVSYVSSSVLRLSSSPFPISVLSPRDGQTERRMDEGSRSWGCKRRGRKRERAKEEGRRRGSESMREEDTTAAIHGGFTQQMRGEQISHRERQKKGVTSQREMETLGRKKKKGWRSINTPAGTPQLWQADLHKCNTSHMHARSRQSTNKHTFIRNAYEDTMATADIMREE